eukprot:826640-Rhodomonas_salina.1
MYSIIRQGDLKKASEAIVLLGQNMQRLESLIVNSMTFASVALLFRGLCTQSDWKVYLERCVIVVDTQLLEYCRCATALADKVFVCLSSRKARLVSELQGDCSFQCVASTDCMLRFFPNVFATEERVRGVRDLDSAFLHGTLPVEARRTLQQHNFALGDSGQPLIVRGITDIPIIWLCPQENEENENGGMDESMLYTKLLRVYCATTSGFVGDIYQVPQHKR